MLLQDWTTVAGSTASITQSRRGWADLAGASNVTFWLEVRDVVSDQGNVRITYETAPCDEDSLFEPIGSVTLKRKTQPCPVVTRA